MEIKNTISFATYKTIIDKVISDTFMNDVYTPENEDISTRVALLLAFTDFEFSEDKDKMWEQAYSDEANEILDSLYLNRQYIALQRAIDKAVQHRLRMVENGSMSLTDYALSQLIKTFNEKVQRLDITDEGIKAVTEAVNKSNETDFAGNLVDAFVKKGMLAKPSRSTRRANGQRSTTRKKKEPIEIVPDDKKE